MFVVGTVVTSGVATQAPYGPALFAGVPSVYVNNGNDVLLSAPVAGVTNQGFTDVGGHGVFGVAVTATPEPASLVLLATGLLALVPAVRRRTRG